jgi:pimeloyl-ACP methyl ester carboxylesterase/DNA-binding CsgD family transcriptional regulator
LPIKFLRTRRGARIAYTTAGSGPAIVFLPPWLTHLEVLEQFSGFAAFRDRVAQQHTFVCYDRWGNGLSDRDRDDFSIEADVDVLLDLADHLHLRRFALYGSSHGGPIAIEFAHRHPGRVSHLVLSATLAHGLFDRAAWESFRSFILADWSLAAHAAAAMSVKGGEPSDLDAMLQMMTRAASPEVAVALQDAFFDRDRVPRLEELRVPTLVLQRRDDPIIPVEEARLLAAQIPGARLEILEGTAHVDFVGDSDGVADRICNFMSGATGAPSAQLTPREGQILDLVAAGSSNADAADRLCLSVRTVERHLLNTYRKLGVRGRAEAAAHWAGQMRSST